MTQAVSAVDFGYDGDGAKVYDYAEVPGTWTMYWNGAVPARGERLLRELFGGVHIV